MYIKSIGIGLPAERVRLGPDFLKGKKHFEEEKEVFFFRASSSDTPLTFALKAAKDAVRRADIKPDEINAVIYAKTLIKDFESWSMSAAICNELGLANKKFLDIYQGCNGMIAAMNVARDMFCTNMNFQNILIATSQILPARFGRHESIDTGAVSSDGGSAMIISREEGRYEILSVEIEYNSTLNDMIKLPSGGFVHIQSSERYEAWSVSENKNAFWGDGPVGFEQFRAPKDRVIKRAIEAAGIKEGEVSFLMMHNYCRLYNATTTDNIVHIPQQRQSTDIGMKFSHMGASDIVVDMDYMDKDIKPGDICMLFQDGAGFSFGAAMIRRR